MDSAGAGTTRYQDWQFRREQLAKSVAAMGQVHREARVRVLDRLLAEYRGKPEAAALARFPYRPGAHLDHRAAVVHHHLGSRAALNAQTPSNIRAAVVLGRIAALHPQNPPRSIGGWLLAQVEARSVYWSLGYWRDELMARIGKAVQASVSQNYVYLTVLEELQHAPKLPEWAVMYMFERLDDPARKAGASEGLFVCCENESVLDYAILAWRDRLAANGADGVARGVQQIFLRPHWRERALEKMRVELASHNLVVRIEALGQLETLGGLDDIALLLDLLALPPQRDEAPCERDVVLHALCKLAGAESAGIAPTAELPHRTGGPVSRHEDWLLRRRRLTHLSPELHPCVAEHRAALDFLLEHFRGTPLANQPARFPAPPQPFEQRHAVLVFHQLGRAEVRGVATETVASKRASSILRRIAAQDPQSSAKAFMASGTIEAGGGMLVGGQAAPVATCLQQELHWKIIEEELGICGFKAHVIRVYHEIEEALELGTQLPERAVYYLVQHLDNPDAVELLCRCGNLSVLEYMVGAWRQRLLRKKKGPARIQPFFFAPLWRTRAADRLRRELLLGDHPKVRLHATRILARLGNLDDIGLLSDVLSLPRMSREDARERPALVNAMRRLTRAELPESVFQNPGAEPPATGSTSTSPCA